MEKNYSDIDFARYFSGEASPEEIESMDAWCKSSPGNLELFLAAKFVWERSLVSEEENYDTEKALRHINKQLNFRKKTISLYLKIAAVAAVFLLPVVLMFLKGGKEDPVGVVYIEIRSEKEQKYIKLDDGSEIWVNSESTISVPENSSGDELKIKLSGEAYFHVAHNSKRVFMVETGTATFKVLGTAFNVKSLAGGKADVLSVTEGKVLCSRISSRLERVVEKGSVARVSADADAIELGKLNDENFLAWKTRTLKFREKPFAEVAATLEEFYNTRLEIADSSLLSLPISTTIVDAPLEKVVNLLQMASDEVEFTKTEDGYLVKRKK
jgi:ferric-dicitrate binding protein FerR (iron transport regulator)